MKAYTDEFISKDDGIYRVELTYTPGTGWKRNLVLWMPKCVKGEESMTNFVDEYDSKKADAETVAELRMANEELVERVRDLENRIKTLNATVNALAFAVRCNGVSGADVKWEDI